jgi:hypothetical protein
MTDSACMHAFDLPKRSDTCAATINKKQHGGISLDIILGSNLSVSVPFYFLQEKQSYPYHSAKTPWIESKFDLGIIRAGHLVWFKMGIDPRLRVPPMHNMKTLHLAPLKS